MSNSQPGFQVNLDVRLWDLVDEGIDDALDRIQGETGATGLVIGLHCPATQQLRTHPLVSPRTFRTQGGAQFQPDPACYAGTRLRPVVGEWLRKRNPLKTVVEGCRQRGLTVGGQVSACDHPALVQRHESVAVRDMFQDRSDHRLCPINPDVAEYFRGLVEDMVGNYGLDFLRIGQIGYAQDSSAVRCAVQLGPVERWLRTVCLCESCRQLAGRDGVDIQSLSGRASAVLDQALWTGTSLDQTVGGFIDEHAEVAAFLAWRSRQMESFLSSLRRACRCTLIVEEHDDFVHSGLDLVAGSSRYDVYSQVCRRPGAQEVDSAVAAALPVREHPARLSLRLDAGQACPDPEALVAGVAQAARAGCHSVDVGGYGLIPPVRLDWIRQAVRFARREAK